MTKTWEKYLGVEGHLNHLLNSIYTLFFLNILFLVFSFCGLTITFSLNALYKSIDCLLDKKLGYTFQFFIKEFVLGFKNSANYICQSILTFYLLTLTMGILAFHYYLPISQLYDFLRVMFLLINVLILIGLQYFFLFYSVHEHSILQAVNTSIILSFRNLPKIILVLIVAILPYILAYLNIIWVPLIILCGVSLPVYIKLKYL